MQLPLISIDNVNEYTDVILKDVHSWRKEMVHYIKDQNPELNTAIIEMAQKTDLDPKALALGAYMTYKLLENELSDGYDDSNFILDDE